MKLTKENILYIIIGILIIFIIFKEFFSNTKVVNIPTISPRFESVENQVIKDDSINTLIFQKLAKEKDSIINYYENKLKLSKNENIRLENNYKIIRISSDSLPDFN